MEVDERERALEVHDLWLIVNEDRVLFVPAKTLLKRVATRREEASCFLVICPRAFVLGAY